MSGGPVAGGSGVLGDPPPAARAVFADALPLAVRYAGVLAGDGVAHGHLGPREVPRVWERHLVNCALVCDLLPADARVVDVGSGAGLPGLPIAIRRPDLQVVLVEPMLRRYEFLVRAVEDLGIGDRVSVVRGRAEDRSVQQAVGPSRYVTARAVAPLDRLLGWCLPLLAAGGELLALKGSTARSELAALTTSVPPAVRRRIGEADVVELGEAYGTDTTFVVRVVRGRPSAGRR